MTTAFNVLEGVNHQACPNAPDLLCLAHPAHPFPTDICL